MTAKTQTKTNSPARQSYALGVGADELKLNKHKVYAFDVVNHGNYDSAYGCVPYSFLDDSRNQPQYQQRTFAARRGNRNPRIHSRRI